MPTHSAILAAGWLAGWLAKRGGTRILNLLTIGMQAAGATWPARPITNSGTTGPELPRPSVRKTASCSPGCSEPHFLHHLNLQISNETGYQPMLSPAR